MGRKSAKLWNAFVEIRTKTPLLLYHHSSLKLIHIIILIIHSCLQLCGPESWVSGGTSRGSATVLVPKASRFMYSPS